MTKDTSNINNFIKLTKNNNLNNKGSLGRGLSALLNDTTQSAPKDADLKLDQNIVKININNCVTSPYQARNNFDETNLQELSDSIKSKGIIQPIIVRKSPSQANKFEIIAGERRCRAARLANIFEVPAIVMNLSNKEVMEVGLIENLQRKNLNPVEEAIAYNSLYTNFGYTHEEIAQSVAKSRSYITNYLRILNLPIEILDLLKEEKLTAGHAKMLVNVENPLAIANKIIEQNLSVKETEELTKNVKNKKSLEKTKNKTLLPLEIIEWQQKVSASCKNITILSTAKNNKEGEIKIKYKDVYELQEILKNF